MPQSGPYQAKATEIYTQLRKNVVDNVFKVRPLQIYGGQYYHTFRRSTNGQDTFGNNMMQSQAKANEGQPLDLFILSSALPTAVPQSPIHGLDIADFTE